MKEERIKYRQKAICIEPLVCMLLVIWLSAGFISSEAQEPVNKKTDNRIILNLWGRLPDETNEIYNSAYEILSNDKDATFSDLSGNSGFRSLVSKYGISHLGGPMLGNISPTSVGIWIRTVNAAEVVAEVSDGESGIISGRGVSSAATDLSTVIRISSLKPSTDYTYKVKIDGRILSSGGKTVFSFRTPPDDKGDLSGRIVFGSCFHRWGLGNMKQADLILSRRPWAVLFMGDVAVQDRMNHTGMHRADYLMRDMIPAWQKLVSVIPVFDTWDDHDYFNDDLAGIPSGFVDSDRFKVWDVYRYSWNNPSYGFGEDGKGVFFRSRLGPADIIMLDNRYFRKNEKGSFLGREQMEWLKKSLIDCKGPFIILSCGTMWSDFVDNGKDSWGTNDPAGREELFGFIEKNDIRGVLLISGDRHGARGFRIERPSGFVFYEFEVAGLGGRVGTAIPDPMPPEQMFGYTGQYMFGEFEFVPGVVDPAVTFRLFHESGEVKYSIQLKRSQLTPSAFRQINH